jgi:hypothetical protein
MRRYLLILLAMVLRTVRWYVWLLVALPAVAGLAALILDLGDFRSSGAVAGVGLSLVGATVLLVRRGRWRGARGARRLVALAPIAALGFVGLLALLAGVPEFVQTRFGWFVPPDAYGPRAIVAVDGTFVVVGDEPDGAVILRSEDGRSWTRAPRAPVLDGLEMRDALTIDGGVMAVGQPLDEPVGQVLTSRDGQTWQATARFGRDVEFGIAPTAIAAANDGVVAVGGIYGNDVVFFHSVDGRRWTTVAPEPVFDDGEDPLDVACDVARCVTVGVQYDAGGMIDGGGRRAVAWSSAHGQPWVPVDDVFGAATVNGVTASDDGFVAVGHDEARTQAKVWTTPDGRAWSMVDDHPDFRNAQMDGVATIDGRVMAYGRHRDTIVVWARDDDGWRRSTVDDTVEPGSRIRAIASNGTTVAAVGIDTSAASTVIWTSADGRRWQRAAVPSTS